MACQGLLGNRWAITKEADWEKAINHVRAVQDAAKREGFEVPTPSKGKHARILAEGL
jgi:hypothetical protein